MRQGEMRRTGSWLAGIAVALAVAGAALPAQAAAAKLKPEKPQIKLGFIKLTDMAPLAIAYEKGYFEEEGLYVTLEAQSNWKVVLDRVISGELDGSHMLAGQPLGATIGIGTKADMLTVYSMAIERVFDLRPLVGLDAAGYDAMPPTQWGAAQLFADGRFQYADGRARFIATVPAEPVHARDSEYPLALNTGRIRDQWHTMTRTALAPKLAAHLPEPFVDLHPQDALAFGLRAGSLVRVATRWGRMVARLRCSGELRRGDVFVPIHWNDCHASDARVGALVNPVVDPHSGEPEFKHTPARVEAFHVAWHGMALWRADPGAALTAAPGVSWWARAAGIGHTRAELAGRSVPGDWRRWAQALLGAPAGADWIEYQDRDGGVYRGAWFRDGALAACVCIAPRPELPSRTWLAELMQQVSLSGMQRASLLAGRPMDPAADAGPTVCACFAVGRNTLTQAIAGGCTSVAQLGQKLKAGTNCGSCLPELRALVEAAAAAAATGDVVTGA